MITRILTGHLHAGGPTESSSDCGNCDGARCENCRTLYLFEGQRYNSAELALEAEAASRNTWEELLPGVEMPFDPQFALNADGELAALCWSWDDGDHLVICNPEASAYDALCAKALKATELWVKCPCVDKGEHPYANDCSLMGCNDSRCQFEVKHKGRKERKWYM